LVILSSKELNKPKVMAEDGRLHIIHPVSRNNKTGLNLYHGTEMLQTLFLQTATTNKQSNAILIVNNNNNKSSSNAVNDYKAIYTTALDTEPSSHIYVQQTSFPTAFQNF